MHRLKALKRRLARLAGIVRGWSELAEHHRELLHARQVFAGLIRDGLRRAGIDPSEAAALRRLDKPEPPPPRLRLRSADPRAAFLADMRRLAERMCGRPPSLADASPMQLFALITASAKAPGRRPHDPPDQPGEGRDPSFRFSCGCTIGPGLRRGGHGEVRAI
jgi:hypothetical protein